FDKIVRQLIERPIEICVEPIVTLVDAYKNLAVKKAVPIERKTGAFADKNTIGAPAGEEFVRNLHSLIKNIVKNLQLRIVDKEEANSRLSEDRTNKFLAGRECASRGLSLR